MFIQTEETPNPATLKFLPGQTVLGTGTANFSEGDKIESSPLAKKLFGVEGVVGVFLGSDFITVTKKENFLWEHIKPAILGTIMEFLQSGEEILNENSMNPSHDIHEGPNSEIVKKITELLDTRVRPAVAQDGGDITFQSFQQGIVYLHMQGACAGCPSSTMTLKMGIENLLKHYIPEVTEVRPVA
ncbi:NifU family protein [Paracoccaceae bacterium]|nr:NifU family protein [Paracoccaceae bacterium]